MHRNAIVVLCVFSIFACVVQAQSAAIESLHAAEGTVLTFHLQTRLHSNIEDETAALPQGTTLRVKMLATIDSGIDHDGAEFSGVIVSPVVSGSEIILHPDAEVRGVLALLRSKSHPEGFRYELLITNVVDHGKSFCITASLNTSFFDGGSHTVATAKVPTK
jgi:hypothetical protein